MTFYILLSLCVFLTALLGTRLVILAHRSRAIPIDVNVLRGFKKEAVPHSGGLAVVVALTIGLLAADIDYAIILALFMLASVSLLNDLIRVPSLVRLLVRLLAVVISLSAMKITFFGQFFSPMIDEVLTVMVWLWLMHVFKNMDKIEGLTASQTISIASGFVLILIIEGVFPNALSSYGIVIAATALGFVWWNWHPAKITLGEVGSVPLGYLVGYLLLLAIQSGYIFPALIIPAYHIADGAITELRRLRYGYKTPVEYYAERAVRAGRKEDAVTCYVIGLNLILAALAVFSIIDSDLAWLHLAVAYMLVFMVLGFFAHEPHDPRYEPF